jgi:hypothetical protein
VKLLIRDVENRVDRLQLAAALEERMPALGPTDTVADRLERLFMERESHGARGEILEEQSPIPTTA